MLPKTDTNTNWAKELDKLNHQFFNDLSREMQQFEQNVERHFKSATHPKNVEEYTRGIILQRINDIKRCFPESPAYISRR